MKRAFLFGVGWALTALTIGLFVFGKYTILSQHAAYIVGCVALPAALLAFWRARHAMPHHSWMVATLCWLLGWLVIAVVCVVCVLMLVWLIGSGP